MVRKSPNWRSTKAANCTLNVRSTGDTGDGCVGLWKDIEASRSSETFMTIVQAIRCHIPENSKTRRKI
jgi:hypothetical protein